MVPASYKTVDLSKQIFHLLDLRPRDVSRLTVSRRSIEESTGVLGEQRPVDREAQLPGHRSEGPSEGIRGPSVARNKRKIIKILRALSVALREGICEP